MNDPRDPVKGCDVPLAEWVKLSAFLENQHGGAARRESKLAFVLRAVEIALRIVDLLELENQDCDQTCDAGKSSLVVEGIVLENFSVEIVADCDPEDLKKSPRRLSAALESVTDVKFFNHAQRKNGVTIKNDQTLPEMLKQVGLIFYYLFSCGQTITTSNDGSDRPKQDFKQSEVRRKYQDEIEDVEQPGAQKGRQKWSIEESCKSFRRFHISSLEHSLSQLDVPASLCIFVKDLIEGPDDVECAFQSLENVSSELRQINSQPEIFLHHGESAIQNGVLGFENKIVGRTDEVRCLLEAAARIEMAGEDATNPHNLILISGDAGSGKSYLVESVRGALETNGWIYLNCKFDRLMAQPLSTIASAFEMFFHNIISLSDEGRDVDALLSSIQENLSASGIVVLSELMPSLCTLYPSVFASIVRDDCSDSDDEERISNEDSNMDDDIISSADTVKNRLHYLFRRLVHSIARPEHPLLLCVDDLQWVDESNIELLYRLLTDSDHLNNDNGGSQRLLVVGTYRDGEVQADDEHLLSDYLKKFNSSPFVSVTDIQLATLNKSDTNALVSEAIQLPIRQTRALADVLQIKTLGNPLFLKEVMKSCVDEKLLHPSLAERRWIWDLDAIRALPIDDSVAVLLTRKLRRLPEKLQTALKVASCFGLQIEEKSLCVLLEADESLTPCFEHARQEGILESDGVRFSHDIIQQAVYDMMSTEEKGECHYGIGIQLVRHLFSSKEAFHFHPITFAAAKQINLAKFLMPKEDLWKDHSLSIPLATINMKAGERSMEVSDFQSALNYLQCGIAFLPETQWDTNYGLTLRLYESACLACYINTRTDKMTEFLEQILKNTNTFEDKLNGLFVLVQTLTSSGKLSESMDKILFILNKLGESFPDEVTPREIQDVLMSVKNTLDGYSKEDLISYPRLNNKRIHWSLKLMAYALPYIFMIKPRLLPLLGCRIVKLSIKHGVASESAFGLSTYSYFQITTLRDIEEGYRWGRVAVSLLESFDAQKLVPKLKILCYHMNFFLVEPLQSTSVGLLQCQREAAMVGDNEYASMGGNFYCAQNILCGSSLPIVEKECTALAMKMVQLHQIPICLTHLTNHQSVLKLIGSTKNPFHVVKAYIENEDQLLHHALSTGRLPLVEAIHFNRLYVAFFMKQYEEAAEYIGKYSPINSMLKRTCYTFYEGLTAFYLARNHSKPNYVEIGEKAMSLFQGLAKHSNWNWENKMLLLEAEWHFCKGDIAKAEGKYELAAESAKKHRFIHEEGLANDLFSAFYKSNGNVDKARRRVSDAKACYEKWGASALVDVLDFSGV